MMSIINGKIVNCCLSIIPLVSLSFIFKITGIILDRNMLHSTFTQFDGLLQFSKKFSLLCSHKGI